MNDPTPHRGPVLAHRDGFDVVDCEVCGYAHLHPLPSDVELEALYADHYYDDNPDWIAKERAEKGYWDLEHDDKLSDWSGLIGQPTGSLLDVGCSGGLLLERARERGWETMGIEPSAHALEETRRLNLDVLPGFYETTDVAPGSFDVIHTKLVFEHLRDPGHFFGWAASVLRPGGVVSIQAPNDFNAAQLQAKTKLGLGAWWVAPPVHINYFTFSSLSRLMATRGFRAASRDATFPVEWFLLMGVNYVGNPEVGSQVHEWRISLETELEKVGTRRAFHQHLAVQGVGRELIINGQLNGADKRRTN